MTSKRVFSIAALASALLAIFSLLLVQAVPPNPRYGPYSDSIWFNPVIGPDAQVSALLEGTKDVGPVPRPVDIPTLKAACFTITSTVRLGMMPLFENNAIYPCNDRAFRKTVNRLVDKDALTNLLYPLQSPMRYWLPPSMEDWGWVADGQWDEGWGQYRPDYPLPQFNPGMPDDTGTDSAYSWLNDNGWTMTAVPNPWYDPEVLWSSPYLRTWPGGEGPMPEFKYTTRSPIESPLYYELSWIINEALHQAGINSKLMPKTWLEIVAILTNDDPYDYQLMTAVGIYWSKPEPAIQYDLYHSSQIPWKNAWVYSDPDMDAACDAIMGTLDYNELKAATMLTQQTLERDEPMLPVMMYNDFTAFNSDILGIVNMLGHGAGGARNIWTKMLIRKCTGGPYINWMLTSYLNTLNPLLADTESDWQVLETIIGRGGQLNPFTLAYMPWALASEPTQVEWDGVPGHEVVGSHMYFELRQGLKWHDGTPVTAEDAVFGLNLMRFQEVENYRPIWEPIYDVVQTGTYTWEVYYDMRYYFAAREVGDICFFTPEHIWEPFIGPTIDVGAGPMGGDVWTWWMRDHSLWCGWAKSIGPDTYNGYPGMELTELIGFGPFIYHLGGWMPGYACHVEANPRYMATSDSDGLRICVGDVNFDQFTDGRDVWHVLKRQGHEKWMRIWYQYLGTSPPLQGPSVDIACPPQIIDGAEISMMTLHVGHWWGVGDPPAGWIKEPPG